MKRLHLLAVLIAMHAASIHASDLGGLIVSGLDTLRGPKEIGWDFLLQQACTTVSSNDCHYHFSFQWYGADGKYVLFADQGYGIRINVDNLDSVSFAPADSIIQSGRYSRVDSIPPDSLEDYIGTVYVIKTGEDPRRGYPFYAKLKILDFNVIEAENHEVEMVFLWAFNRSGPIDLRTTNLDTFDLTTDTHRPVAHNRKHVRSAAARSARVRFVPGAGVRVVGPGVRGSKRERVFDVRGRCD